MQLVKYERACRAIAEAKAIDEVLEIRNVAVAMKAYAKQANNHKLEADAIEIRMRAIRRMDQMRQEQASTIGLAKGKQSPKGFVKNPLGPPTLAEAGIGKNLAHEGRKLGALTEQQFEKTVKEARESVDRVVKNVLGQDQQGLAANISLLRRKTPPSDEEHIRWTLNQVRGDIITGWRNIQDPKSEKRLFRALRKLIGRLEKADRESLSDGRKRLCV